ncbi:permease [Streptomyces sp. H27-D2]|uniref:permease n=1 Tax=Streptomyces sp. H27-D2 TaxID=3046304 RepID=UPI002DB6E007|nr:permease [Streptomyces sp. H27-D2]MEC4015442.1 permease [Streptomyces sp. H27-D2]
MSELQALGLFVLREALHYLPWFLFAIVLGVAVQRLSIDVVARRNFTRSGILGIAVVTAIGAFSPFCSFTVIPLIRRFLIAGVPLSAVMSFWIASPSMDPEIYALSASQLGVPLATARLVGALVLSFGAGLIVLALERRGHFANALRAVKSAPATSCSKTEVPSRTEVPEPAPACSAVTAAAVAPAAATVAAGLGDGGGTDLAHEARPPSACSAVAEQDPLVDDGTPWRVLARRDIKQLKARDVLKEIWGDSLALGKWLLLAIVLEALIVRYVPTSAVSSLLGVDGVLSVLAAGLISVPLYLNGVGAIPVVDGLLDQGMLAAAGVTFLLGGAVTTIPAMVAVRSVVNGRVFSLYLAIGMLGSIGIGLVALPFL